MKTTGTGNCSVGCSIFLYFYIFFQTDLDCLVVCYSEEAVENNERKAKVNKRVKAARVVIEDDIGMWKWQFMTLLMGITAHSVPAASNLIMVRFLYETD